LGLLKHLLFWPVTGPAALVRFSLRQVDGVAKQELTDDTKTKEDLMALQMQLEIGDIDLAEYEAAERELMQRLREAREWRVELGMEQEWAPLEYRSQRPDEAPDDPSPGREPEDWPPPAGSPPSSPPDSSSS
jgi:hypothetical protein